MAQQGVVGERGRSDLKAWRIEPIDEIHRLLIPAGGQPRHLHLAAIAVDQLVFILAELQAALEVAIGQAERTLPRLGQFLRSIHHIHGALLELDRVAAGGHGHADEPARDIDISVMVDADLGNNVHGTTGADQLIANPHGHSEISVGFHS